MVDAYSLEKLRPCGRLETYSTFRHHLNFYTNVGTTATYSHPPYSIPLEHVLFPALRQVIKQHSILSAIALNEDQSYPGPYFARLPSIDLRTCITFVTRNKPVRSDTEDAELDALLSHQHNLDFKENLGTAPFWRLTILTAPPESKSAEFTAVWTVHHALADGTSGLVFHRALLEALQATSPTISAEQVDPIVISPTTPLHPPLENLHPLPISILFLLQQQWNEWFPSPPTKLWTGGPIASPQPTRPQTQVSTLVLPAPQTTQLIAASRANATTVTAVLQTLLASALFANLDPKEFSTLQGNGALSLRPNLTLQDADVNEQMGVWVSRWIHTFERLPSPTTTTTTKTSHALSSFSWDEARAVRKTITREVSGNGKNSVVGLFRWVPDLHQFFTKRIGLTRSESFEISNVGVFKQKLVDAGKGKEGWKIGRAVFSQCGSVAGAAFSVSVVTGGDGCLSMAFGWLEGVVEGGLMERVMASVREGVDGILEAAA